MKEKIKNYVLSTKLGYFLALIVLSVLMELLLLVFAPKLFLPTVVSSVIIALFLSIINENERWV